MDKTDKQRLDILKRISSNNRSMSGSRSGNTPNRSGGGVNPINQNKEASATPQPKPGCNVCSRNKRT